jgi:hypothetical protein
MVVIDPKCNWGRAVRKSVKVNRWTRLVLGLPGRFYFNSSGMATNFVSTKFNSSNTRFKMKSRA